MSKPTPYRVICPVHGGQFLTTRNYLIQLDHPDAVWTCPICGLDSAWDADHYENFLGT